jgi:hypothetical protein
VSSRRIVSICLQAAFWASTPTAFWNETNALSNSVEAYWDEFQMPFERRAALR